jgi:hypothetical protein
MTEPKKRIGIFGDSFGNSYHGFKSVNNILWQSWPRVLETKHNFDVSNFCFGGSSLFYSHKKFIDNHHDIDVAIFIVTESFRIYHKNENLRLGNIQTIKEHMKTLSIYDPSYDVYKAAEMYYLHLSDADFNMYIRDKIVQDFITTCMENNIKPLILPGFDKDIKSAVHFRTTLAEISLQEVYTQFGDRQARPETKNRPCHLSIENNEKLAYILAKIINGVNWIIKLEDFTYTKVNDPEKYWKVT